MKTLIFSFGRMNPPSVGHAKLVRVMVDIKNRKDSQFAKLIDPRDQVDIWLGSSKSQGNDKNPLTNQQKLFWLKKIFFSGNKPVSDIDLYTTAFELLDKANGQYDKCYFVIGSDRYQSFKRFEKYNHDLFDFKDFQVISPNALKRDAGSEDLSSAISASVLRKFAAEDNFEAFKRGTDYNSVCPCVKNLSDQDERELFDQVRAALIKAKTLNEHALQQMLTEAVNKHSTHIEELPLFQGKAGLDAAINGFGEILNNLAKSEKGVSTKIDGSPALFFGYDNQGKFFVANKGIFNKNPKINYSEDDVNTNHPDSGVSVKLKQALKYLPLVTPINKNTVYQGDMLFDRSDLKTRTIKGTECWLFQPNTIAYTVVKDSNIGKRINKAEFGIAIHTKYKWDGQDPKTLEVTAFGISKDEFKSNSKVFLIDTVSNFSSEGKDSLTKAQRNKIDNLLHQCQAIGQTIDWKVLDRPSFVTLVTQFINKYIRDDVEMPEPNERYNQFIEYVENKYHIDVDGYDDPETGEHIGGKKTERGKQTATLKWQAILTIKENIDDVKKLFEIFDNLTKIKLIIIDALDNQSAFKNFVVDQRGNLLDTGEEGFVVSTGKAKGTKLVNRRVFSRNNFSKDIKHGFEKDSAR